MMSVARSWLVLLIAAFALGACGGMLQKGARPAQHDLGGPRAARTVGVPLESIEAHAAGWLDGTGIQYRLAYRSATERLSYAESRWASSPADMLAVALRGALDTPARPRGCRLVIDIDEFIQVFSSPSQAEVLLAGRATLIDARGRHLIDRMRFSLTETAGPDAAGGVAAFSRATDALAGRLADWLDRTAGRNKECEQ